MQKYNPRASIQEASNCAKLNTAISLEKPRSWRTMDRVVGIRPGL